MKLLLLSFIEKSVVIVADKIITMAAPCLTKQSGFW